MRPLPFSISALMCIAVLLINELGLCARSESPDRQSGFTVLNDTPPENILESASTRGSYASKNDDRSPIKDDTFGGYHYPEPSNPLPDYANAGYVYPVPDNPLLDFGQSENTVQEFNGYHYPRPDNPMRLPEAMAR